MLNSVEHEILNANKYKNIKHFSFFFGSGKPIMFFFLFLNVKMPAITGILTFMNRKNFMLDLVEHKKVYNLGTRWPQSYPHQNPHCNWLGKRDKLYE